MAPKSARATSIRMAVVRLNLTPIFRSVAPRFMHARLPAQLGMLSRWSFNILSLSRIVQDGRHRIVTLDLLNCKEVPSMDDVGTIAVKA